jgi:RNA polymerase sigma-70 factor, ECF subfamily
VSAQVVPIPKKEEPLGRRSDDELMLLAAAGVRGAFEALCARHAGRLLGFCVKSVGDRAAGEELAQELWLSVWGHRRDYRPEGKFVVWLFTLARNRLRNAARDRGRRPSWGGDEALALGHEAVAPSELDALIAQERQARLTRALAAVSPTLREAIVLRFAEELSYDEIARIVGTNESTARGRVFHGLRELRRRLRGES